MQKSATNYTGVTPFDFNDTCSCSQRAGFAALLNAGGLKRRAGELRLVYFTPQATDLWNQIPGNAGGEGVLALTQERADQPRKGQPLGKAATSAAEHGWRNGSQGSSFLSSLFLPTPCA